MNGRAAGQSAARGLGLQASGSLWQVGLHLLLSGSGASHQAGDGCEEDAVGLVRLARLVLAREQVHVKQKERLGRLRGKKSVF